MRKIIHVFCVISFACIFALGCSNNEYYDGYSEENSELSMSESTKGNLNLKIPEEYKMIGEKHNEGLESAFASIRNYYEQSSTRSNDVLCNLTKDGFSMIAQKGLKKFCEENLGDYSDLFRQMPYQARTTTRSQTGFENSKIATFVDKIKEVLENEPKSSEQLVEKLNKISKKASRELPELEAVAVYAGISTCYNSYMYWKENHMKWFLILNQPNLVKEFSDEELNCFMLKEGKLIAPVQTRGWWDDAWSSVGETWDSTKNYVSDWWNYGGGKEVVGTDAGDAVQGAMEGALVGAYVEGWGAIPGAVVGGIGVGASSSISAAIQSWIMN